MHNPFDTKQNKISSTIRMKQSDSIILFIRNVLHFRETLIHYDGFYDIRHTTLCKRVVRINGFLNILNVRCHSYGFFCLVMIISVETIKRFDWGREEENNN